MSPVNPSTRQPLPATSVLTLSRHSPVVSTDRAQKASETVHAAVKFPPRTAEPRPLGELLPEVLAGYGLTAPQPHRGLEETFEAVA